MADELKIILFTLLSKFIKRSVLDSATTMAQLAKIDVYKDTNLVPAKKVDIGFAASRNVEHVVKEKSASELQVFEFQKECMTFLQYLTSKLLERCPLKYQIVRVLNAYDPKYFIQHQDSAIEKFELILKKFLEKKWLTATKCDTLLQQYRVWLKKEGDTDANACQSSDPKKERLDSFMHEKMGSREHLNEL